MNLKTPTRDVVSPPSRHALYELHRYSPAIRANGLLFVSGQVGSRPDGSPEPDLDEQVRLAFRNLNAILAEAGLSFDDVIDVTVFMVDPHTHFERSSGARRRTPPPPPSASPGCRASSSRSR
jgi:enamine deaminase RidA (YjgF/YER057c/UK114 family)